MLNKVRLESLSLTTQSGLQNIQSMAINIIERSPHYFVEQSIYTFNYRERNKKSGSCILGHFGYKEMYINIPESRVIKESKNNHTAMHENNVM